MARPTAEDRRRLAGVQAGVALALRKLASHADSPSSLEDRLAEVAAWVGAGTVPGPYRQALDEPAVTMIKLFESLTALRELVGEDEYAEGLAEMVYASGEAWEAAHEGDESDEDEADRPAEPRRGSYLPFEDE